jgi:hypothetical protein
MKELLRGDSTISLEAECGTLLLLFRLYYRPAVMFKTSSDILFFFKMLEE